jgi:Zn-dependent peptidase ImmA (M78 family)
VGAYLSRELGRPESAVAAARKVLPVRGNRPPWAQGYELGERARDRLLPGNHPIGSVQAAFESLGIHVALVDFDSHEIDSASLYEASALPTVLLNRQSERVTRELSRRAILAHELCHLLHDGGERDLLAAISREHDHADIERRANGFAPSFLAPKSYVSIGAPDPKSKVAELAYTWGFTFEGAAWHAKNLELIGPDDATRLLNERRFGATAQPAFEQSPPRRSVQDILDTADVSPLVHGLVADLTVIAHIEGIISRARAREILTLQ